MPDLDLSQLYERYGFAVHRRCRQLLRNPADADEALQEVFVRAHRYQTGYRGGSMLSWLYSIATNACFDLMRTRERHGEALLEPALEAHAAPADADRQALVGLALRSMDEKTRSIGVLHFLHGLTQEEVATETGISRKTVGKRLGDFEAKFRALWDRRTP